MSLNHALNIESVRQSLPVLRKFVYMNTGSVGPLPLKTSEAIRAELENELLNGRIGIYVSQRKKAVKIEVREVVAKLINAKPDEITLTQNTTEGINLVIAGRNWHKGDEVVTTNVEHGAVLLPLSLIGERYGVTIKKANIRNNPLQGIKEQISNKTKLIALSHVSFSTGEILPLNDIIRFAHDRGIPVLVDGAQSVGAIPVDVQELEVDYYSLPGQKWLLGPEGTGALYIKNDRLAELLQTYIGYGSIEQFSHDGSFKPHDSAQRFEVASVNLSGLVGQKTSLQWLTEDVGWKKIFERSNRLAETARTELSGIAGVTVITPQKAAGLVSFRVAGIEPQTVVETLSRQGIIIRKIAELSVSRAAIGFYNTEAEVEGLIRTVADLVNK